MADFCGLAWFCKIGRKDGTSGFSQRKEIVEVECVSQVPTFQCAAYIGPDYVSPVMLTELAQLWEGAKNKIKVYDDCCFIGIQNF